MGLRILLTAEQVLGGRTPRRDADKQRLVARRNDLAGFEERGVRLAEVADRASEVARARRSSIRSSLGADCGSRRSALPNHCAALAGAR